MVLMLLAVGAFFLTPALNLASTGLRSKQIQTSLLQEQYARDAGAEYALWQLKYGGLAQTLTGEGQEAYYTVSLNDMTSSVTIRLRATEGLSGASLAHPDWKVFPSSVVVPTDPNVGELTVFTYTFTLKELDPNLANAVVDEVWDELPPGFSYVPGSSQFEGSPIPDPIIDYKPAYDVFTVHWLFDPKITFSEYGEEKTLVFQALATPFYNTRYCNGVALEPNGEQWGKDAIIELGTPPSGCLGGKVVLSATADPKIAAPGVETTFTYTFSYYNLDIGQHGIDEIRAIFPANFTYIAGSAGEFANNMTTDEPQISTGIDGRQVLKWDCDNLSRAFSGRV